MIVRKILLSFWFGLCLAPISNVPAASAATHSSACADHLRIYTVQTERLAFRQLSQQDLDALQDISVATGFPPENKRFFAQKWIAHAAEFADTGVFTSRRQQADFGIILRATGALIGSIEIATPFKESIEIGYTILPAYEGHGYATETVRAFTPYVFQHLGYTRIRANTTLDNKASQRVLEKAGFRPIGPRYSGAHETIMFYYQLKR